MATSTSPLINYVDAAPLSPPFGNPSYHVDGSYNYLGSYFESDAVADESAIMAAEHLERTSTQSFATANQSTPSESQEKSTKGQPKRLRSQYPYDPNQSHVEFILVASFDIDRGSIMEHQYPGSISGDEHMLAELMLPDQVHNRSQDWTIFFLHKDAGGDEGDDDQQSLERKRQRRRRRPPDIGTASGSQEDLPAEDGESDYTSSEDEDGDGNTIEGPPLTYVLNLVNTKHDSSVKRGAIVKAMAICTRHPFLHIYKPLLLLALDEYFKAPNLGTLESLYNAVNAMDLSLMPRLSLLERHILQATASKDMFIEKFQRMIDERREDEAESALESQNGASSPKKSHDGQPTPTTQYSLPRDTHDFDSRIVYNGISVPVKIPAARSPETVGDFSIIKLIQTFSGPHTQSAQSFIQHPHLTTAGPYTHPIIVLVNALLTQKRIIFLGHNLPSGDVAEAVLASCALASGGVLRGFTRHAFPYTDLTKIDDLLKVPGFIAGVTNPAFANKPEWWDVLCDLTTGRMKISNFLEMPQITEGILSFQQQNPTVMNPANFQALQAQDAAGDTAFMENILRGITNRVGENSIRSMWRDWILKMVRMSAAFEEAVYGASALYIGAQEADAGSFGIKGHGYVWVDDATRQRELAAHINRIEGWRNTRSYYSLIQDLAHLYNSRPISSIDLHYHHDRLRSLKLTQDESASIYLAFANVIQSTREICQLLTVTPESHGGLFYISLGLIHPRRDVRVKTGELLQRIKMHEAGRHFWESLGRFSKVAHLRLEREVSEAAARSQGRGSGYDSGVDSATKLLEETGMAS